MTVTLVLPDELASAVRKLVDLDVESAAVLLTRPVDAPNGDSRLLGTDLLVVPDDAYEIRDEHQLLIRSSGYVPALGAAENQGATPVWFHTHPGIGASPRASRHDRIVDNALSDLFRLRSGSAYYGSIIISPGHDQLKFTGHLDNGHSRLPIDRLLTVGSRLSVARNDLAAGPRAGPMFDRNIRAFGGAVQRTLSDLRVGIVGCGGTGSCIAEQLVRLGVRNLVLIDPDRLTISNVTRVYGSHPNEVGKNKVDILAGHLRRIAPDLAVDAIPSTVNVEAVARRLSSVDVAFGCTDDNAGRLVLSRLSTYLIVPVIDCGVLLYDENGRLEGIYGRVSVMHPGAACLVCRGRIDLRRAGVELITPEERVRLTDEGYAPALPGIEPAVVAYTTMVGAYAVGELLERLIGYGQAPSPSEVILRIHDREVSTNSQEPRIGHYCHAASRKLGLGTTDPFLEQSWAA